VKYSSNIVFLYYKDFVKGCRFIEEVLGLNVVMNQGFAHVYQISDKAFLGAVKAKKGSVSSEYHGGVLVSLTTNDVYGEYNRISGLEVKELSKMKYFKDIPLHSFFFKDDEGHDFEIQQFDNEIDKMTF